MKQPELKMSGYCKYVTYWRERKGFITKEENMLEKLMLVVTEIAEAAEAWRVGWDFSNPALPEAQHFKEEIADTFIRLMDICGSLGIDIEVEIGEKMAENENRPYLHGKRA